MMSARLSFARCVAAAAVIFVGCHDDDDGEMDATGRPCETAEECYLGIDRELIQGEVVCMDRVEDGYCTHYCSDDEDCCTILGECEEDLPEVCAPFESTDDKYCFVSCEDVEDEENYCQLWVHPEFICRSTGGGDENRKVCVPN